MASKFEFVATGNDTGKGGYWVSDAQGNNRVQVIDNQGNWVGGKITSTSPSSSPSTSVSTSPSTSRSTSLSSSPSTSRSSSTSSSPSAS